MKEKPVRAPNSNIEVRLALTSAEVRAAQHLRTRAFNPMIIDTSGRRVARFDADGFDDHAKHLLAFIRDENSNEERLVGTCRLIDSDLARCGIGFATEREFDLRAVYASRQKFLELSRWCIDPEFRNGGVAVRMWRSLKNLLPSCEYEFVFGCASLPGVNKSAWRAQLGRLSGVLSTGTSFGVTAISGTDSFRVTATGDAHSASKTFRSLPPLLRVYLRHGAKIGPYAVVDYCFRTIDLFVIAELDRVTI